MPVWEYYAASPDDGARFDAAMAAMTGGLAEAVVASYDFSGFGRVVDVGGGDGTLLAAILRSAPSARGVLSTSPRSWTGRSRRLSRPVCWTEPSWSAGTSAPPYRPVRTAAC
jgi:hypothetical protein